jgi:hypothetical protein
MVGCVYFLAFVKNRLFYFKYAKYSTLSACSFPNVSPFSPSGVGGGGVNCDLSCPTLRRAGSSRLRPRRHLPEARLGKTGEHAGMMRLWSFYGESRRRRSSSRRNHVHGYALFAWEILLMALLFLSKHTFDCITMGALVVKALTLAHRIFVGPDFFLSIVFSSLAKQ